MYLFSVKLALISARLSSFAKSPEKRIPTIDNLKEHSLVKESE